MTEKTPQATQMITFETRLPRDLDATSCAALEAYSGLFSKLARRYFRDSQKGSVSKNDFLKDHGLTGRQYNAIRVSVDGMVQSQLSNLANYVTQNQGKAGLLAGRIEKKKKYLKENKRVRFSKKGRKIWSTIENMQRRMERLLDRARNFQARIDKKQASICFGSKKLFNAQHHLDENNFQSHEDWKAAWQAARSAQFFVLGSSDEAGGNQGCTLIDQQDGRYTLRVRLPNDLVTEHGQYAYLTDIEFPYRKDLIEAAALNNRLRDQKKAEHNQLIREKKRRIKDGKPQEGDEQPDKKESEVLSGLGQSLSYRFVRDKKGWRVLISTNLKKPMPEKRTKHGVIGLDFNADHVALAETDAKGQKVRLDSLPLAACQATSAQNRTQMEAIAKTVVDLAKFINKSIIIEKLDFKAKKASLQKGDKSQAEYHRMLSKLSYKAFRDALIMRAFKEGVAVIEVNPAYTSLIGRLKYGRETKFNTHQAAAWVIARRGQGKQDSIPKKCAVRVVNVTQVFKPPVDGKKASAGSFNRIYKDFSTWCKAEREEWRLRRNNWRESHSLDLPDFI